MTLIAPLTQAHEALSLTDKKIIASVLTWDTQRDVLPEEVEALAINHDIVWVKLTDNRAIPLHVETFKSIRHQQLEEQAAENRPAFSSGVPPLGGEFSKTEVISDVEYVMELEARLEGDTTEKVEIDSAVPGIYRVWKDMTFIGTVRRCKRTLCWIAKPLGATVGQPYLTSKLAISAVVEACEAV